MLKAGALIYAIFISFLIALTSSSIIFISFTNRARTDHAFENERLLLNAQSGIELLMSRQTLVPTDQPKTLDLYGKGMDSVSLEQKSWGLFGIAVSKAFSKRMEERKVVLIGSSASKVDSIAVFLADMDKPLSLCGETVLKGKCYLPAAGIKRAYIEGKNFIGTELVNGTILKSEKNLPALDENLLKQIQSLGEGTLAPSDSVIDIRFLITQDSLIRSFTKSTFYFTSSAPVVLDRKTLQGNLVILSSKSVTIKANCNISGILVYAPEIVLEDGFSGSLQAFAGNSLLVGKKCVLTYPTVLGVYRNKNSKNKLTLKLDEDVTCLGILFAGQEGADPKKQVEISLSKNDVVYGQVYSTGSVDLKGAVYGVVFCSKFVLHTPSSVYENHLMDVTVDITRLPIGYGGIALRQEKGSEHKCIVKWLE
jgi:hypothetical protein